MPDKRGIGDFARGSLKVAEYAQSLQALALDSIRDQFAAASSLDFDRGVTHREFILALTEATESGQRDAFEMMLAQKLGATWVAFQEAQAAAAAQGQEA